MKALRKETVVLLGIIFVIGLGLRIAHVEMSNVTNPTRADAGEYLAGALNLLEFGIYSSDTRNVPPIPDSFRSPGYPLFLAGVHRLTGPDHFYDWLRRIQAVLGALMVPLTFLLARRFLSVTLAVIAAALVAVNPHLVVATGYLLTETLFGLLVLSAMVLLYGGLGGGGRLKIVLAGVCFGLATLTNETALVIAPVLAVAHTFCGKGTRRWQAAALLLAVFVVFPVGWKVRNAISVPPEGRRGSDRALATMVHGTYPGFVHQDPKWKYYPYRDDPQYLEFAESTGNFKRIFAERFRERPGRYLSWYLLEKPVHIHGFGYLQGAGDIYIYPTGDSVFDQVPATKAFYWLHRLLHPVFVGLLVVALGLWLLKLSRSDLWETPGPLLLVFLIYTLIGTVFAPWPRYLVPLKPFLFLAALWPVGLAISRWSTRRPPKGQ